MMEQNPFPGLNIASSDFLDDLQGRQNCPKCEKSRKFFCYSCCVPIAGTEDKIPRIKLPIKIDIIKHPKEVEGKSTSAHAAIIAPEDACVFTYPAVPEYTDKNKVLLLYPGKTSLTMKEYAMKYSRPITSSADESCDKKKVQSCDDTQLTNSKCDKCRQIYISPKFEKMSLNCNTSDKTENCDKNTSLGGAMSDLRLGEPCLGCGRDLAKKPMKYAPVFERVVFIDSTWYQAHQIYTDDRIKCLPHIELKSQTTKFWRYHKGKPSTYLSTIEAVYYLLREYHNLYEPSEYCGQYDDMLFYFVFFYRKIREQYKGSKVLKAYEQQAEQRAGGKGKKQLQKKQQQQQAEQGAGRKGKEQQQKQQQRIAATTLDVKQTTRMNTVATEVPVNIQDINTKTQNCNDKT